VVPIYTCFSLEDSDNELWTPATPFAFADALEITTENTENKIERIGDADLPEPTLPSVKPLTPEQFTLKREDQQISNNNKYTLLLHTAWQQKLTDIYSTKSVHISGGGIFDLNGKDVNEVDGIVTISKGKFLKIKTNLNLTEPSYEISKIPNGLLSYPIRNTRNTKENELNYIDNPVFGMLIKVTPAV